MITCVRILPVLRSKRFFPVRSILLNSGNFRYSWTETSGIRKNMQLVHRRYFFNYLPKPFGLMTRNEFCEEGIVGYSAEQMYQVVIAVDDYETFVPWCVKSKVISRGVEQMQADLQIGFPPLVESYTSSVFFVFPSQVTAYNKDSKIFNHLETIWRFGPGLKNNPKTCSVYLKIAFEFHSLLHSQLASKYMDEVVKKMRSAFIARAFHLYGKESVTS